MVETLLQRNVKATKIVTVGKKWSRALGDPVRVQILEVLSHKPMNADELTKALTNLGHKKAVTTIRHHLAALKSAGLIETTRMIEVRGAVMKYYSARVRAYSFESPQNLDEDHTKLIEDTSSKLLKIMRGIYADKKFLSAFDKNNTTCSLCKTNHFLDYAALEIVNHGLARAMERKELHGPVVSNKEIKS
jgi:Predicted transcriptional regulator